MKSEEVENSAVAPDFVIKLTTATSIGKRDYQEDRIIVGSFGKDERYFVCASADGHGRSDCAEYLKLHLLDTLEKYSRQVKISDVEKILQLTSEELHRKWKRNLGNVRAGSTLTGAILDKFDATYVYTFNLGDSQTVLYDANFRKLYETEDHDLSPERTRQVRDQCPKAFIGQDEAGITRIITSESGLNLSGSYGNTYDTELDNALIRRLETAKVMLNLGQKYHLLIASDGLYDDFSASVIGSLLAKSQELRNADKIVDYVLKNGVKGDNCSVILLEIQS